MADESANTPPGEKTAAKQPGLMALIKPLAVVSVIVLLEVAMASVVMPSADETRDIAEKLADAETDGDPDEIAEEQEQEEASDEFEAGPEMREVNLGAFHVLSYDAETGASLNVDFELFGTVLADEESEFYQLYENNQRRISEQVVVVIRGTSVTDLTDAGLGLIKRKILEKTNAALGKPLLHEALFPKFSFVER